MSTSIPFSSLEELDDYLQDQGLATGAEAGSLLTRKGIIAFIGMGHRLCLELGVVEETVLHGAMRACVPARFRAVTAATAERFARELEDE